MSAAEEDVVETGVGLSAFFREGVDAEWRFGRDYSGYALGGRINSGF